MKVFFDRSLLQNEPRVVFLNPLLGNFPWKIRWHAESQIEEWTKNGKCLLEESSLKECDIVVYPKFFKLDYFMELRKIAEQAEHYHKKVLVFYISDIDTTIYISNILVFRTSISRKNPDSEYCMPPFPKDVWNNYTIPPQSKNNISIGYTWYSNFYDIKSRIFYWGLNSIRYIIKIPYIKKLLYSFHKENLYHLLSTIGTGKYVRGKVIKQFKKTPNITFNFIERRGWMYFDTPQNYQDEFIKNILHNTFSLVMRGNGNYSFRMYEVMSLWKIPVFIDTNCRLPFEEKIDYKRLFVWIPFNDLKNADTYLQAYWNKNNHHLEEIWKEIRRVYTDYFTMEQYFKKIIYDIILKH